MPERIKMEKEGFTMEDLVNFLVAGGVVAMEECVKHPLGTLMAVFGLVYMFFRSRTQYIEY